MTSAENYENMFNTERQTWYEKIFNGKFKTKTKSGNDKAEFNLFDIYELKITKSWKTF